MFVKIGDIKGESHGRQAQGRDRRAVVVLGRARRRGTHGARRRRRRGQGELPATCSFMHRRRQGVAGADEGVRDGRAHQGSDAHASRKAGKGQQEYLIIKMNDVLITSVQPSGAAIGRARRRASSLQFAKVDLEYKPQKADGSARRGRALQLRHQAEQGRLGRARSWHVAVRGATQVRAAPATCS